MKASLRKLPTIRLRWRILAPFILLVLVLGGGMIILANRFLSTGSDVTFTRQLRDSGQRAADEVVRVEDELLTLERAIANTEGVAAAVVRADAEDLRARILQLVVNADVDAVTILDREGTSLLSIRHSQIDSPPGEYSTLRGEGFYAEWPFVRELLDLDLIAFFSEEEEGAKRVGLGVLTFEQKTVDVFFVGGPLVDEQGTVFGAVLVGAYVPNMAVDLSETARANVSFYNENGSLISTVFKEDSSWDPPGLTLSQAMIGAARDPDGAIAPLRDVRVAGQSYGEVLTPFLARGGSVELGTLGIALLSSGEEEVITGVIERSMSQILLLTAGGVLLVLIIAILAANSITQPIDELRMITQRILEGETDVVFPEPRNDELGELVQSLTSVAEGLQSGSLSSKAFMSRQIQADSGVGDFPAEEGLRMMKASILSVAFHDYISDLDRTNPQLLTSTLNNFLGDLVPIVEQHDGMLQRVDGDRFLISFGLPPRRLPASVSSFLATHAALSIVEYAAEQKAAGKEIQLSLGLASGPVYVGQLGTKDCLHSGVFGDTVELARLVETISHTGRGGHLLIAESTYSYISRAGEQFMFGRRGKVKADNGQEYAIYEVNGRKNRLMDEREAL